MEEAGSLSEQEVLVESWGGKIQDVEISAMTGAGIDKLMESLLLETDVLELKTNKDCSARGTVVDSRLDKGLGPVGTVLVQKGTLNVGDPFICGDFPSIDHMSFRIQFLSRIQWIHPLPFHLLLQSTILQDSFDKNPIDSLDQYSVHLFLSRDD